ncbi:major facilitator superfamily transporter [Zalerion maritima]|uniref:Major facilitator superfamily transporter n=1 Tax=Zalerion maritima TaxID=339359 RepID=A0AAD5RML0_9PEZI|nr:major facilitator superfamily transporter [Zalerion maritima]
MVDSSIVATSLYTIGTNFDGLEEVNWVALSYTLAYLGLAVFIARLSDVVGRQTAFLASLMVFAAFSIGCARASTLHQLIALRAIQGIGGSGLYSLSMVILPEITPSRRQHVIGAIIGAVIAAAGAVGPVIGGVLTEYKSWEWIFWIKWVMNTHPQRNSWAEVDYVGAFLVISASILVVFSFQYTGDQQRTQEGSGWSEATFIAPLVVGVALLGALIGWEKFAERKWSDRQLSCFPLVLLRNEYPAVVLYTALVGFSFFMLVFSFPLRLQVVDRLSPFEAGLRLLPVLGGSAVGSSVGGIVNGKADWMCEAMAISGCLMMLGYGLLNMEESSAWYFFLVLVGLGFGAASATATIFTHVRSPIRHIAPAQGIVAQSRLLGGSIGIAISTVILSLQMKEFGRNQVLTLEQLSSLGMDPQETLAIIDATTRETVGDAFVQAFATNMKVSTAVAAAAVLAALATFRPYKSRLTPKARIELLQASELEYRRSRAEVT